MILAGATLVTLDPPGVEQADLRIEGDTIVERGAHLPPPPGVEVMDVSGALILPGLVNAHTHLYSALARGMPSPARPPRDFLDVLRLVWWRLDRALDADTVYLSALVGAMEAVLSGTTLLVDHHSSPSFITGSLATVKAAVEAVGLRSVLCYEVTDRNGREGRAAGVAENVAFIESGKSALTRGMVGAHASFTLDDQTLDSLAEALRRTETGLHVHVAEDKADVEDCQRRHGTTVPERLSRHGLLGPRTLLAHCVHLAAEQIGDAQQKGCWIAHNPRSNMNNAVGHAPTATLHRAGLGTDGIDEDMLAEARAAYLKMREAGRGDAAAAALDLLAGGHRLGTALFGLPFGRLGPGAPADLVVLTYRPPTPITSDNLAGHLLFGIDRSHVDSVLVAGRVVVRDRRLSALDATAIAPRARDAARALWARMQALPE